MITRSNLLLLFVIALIYIITNSSHSQLKITGNETDNNPTSLPGLLVNSVLWNQMDSSGGTGSASQQFPDFSNNYIETAEDFTVPFGYNWRIDSIDCGGQWSNSGPMVTIKCNIYSDSGNAGIRPGAILFRDSLIVPVTALNNASPTFKLPTPRTLAGGIKYWISVMTVHSYVASGQWFWSTRIKRLSPCVLRDPGNLLAQGTAWRVSTTAPYQGVQIRIRGEESTIPPPPYPTMSFCRTGLSVPIANFSTTFDSVNVAMPPICVVRDVNVKIANVEHTWDSDLIFYLRKNTTGALIINQAGGSGDNFINTILNDSAVLPISSGTAPFTGEYKPFAPLTIFNGIQSAGYWKLAITDTTGGDFGTLTGWCLLLTYDCFEGGLQTIEIPNYYSLGQNFPNPFNPVTSINFTIPKSDIVKLIIFDITGREVKTLVHEYRDPGVYNVSFDASSYSSGAYFYRLEAGNFTETRKMILIK